MTTARNRSQAKLTLQARVLLSCLGLCGVLLTLLWGSEARAHAPMCDETAASIDAPLPAPPADSGEITAIDCDLVFEDQSRVVPGLPGHPKSPPHMTSEFDAVLELSLSRPQWSALADKLTSTVPAVRSSDHRRRIERPPCVN